MSVRVIAGSLKNRVLGVPGGRTTRPTSARVREALFSILGDLQGLRVLDLYAGSGALGIEALSRGADFATFVERDPRACECIRDNLERLKLWERARVMQRDVASALSELAKGTRFDWILVDPPWSELEKASRALARLPELLSPNGRVAIEHPKNARVEFEGLTAYDSRRWGDTSISFHTLAPES